MVGYRKPEGKGNTYEKDSQISKRIGMLPVLRNGLGGGILRFIPVARQWPEEEICIVNNASPVEEDDNTSGYDEPQEKEEDFSV